MTQEEDGALAAAYLEIEQVTLELAIWAEIVKQNEMRRRNAPRYCNHCGRGDNLSSSEPFWRQDRQLWEEAAERLSKARARAFAIERALRG